MSKMQLEREKSTQNLLTSKPHVTHSHSRVCIHLQSSPYFRFQLYIHRATLHDNESILQRITMSPDARSDSTSDASVFEVSLGAAHMAILTADRTVATCVVRTIRS